MSVLEKLSEEEFQELADGLRIKLTPYIPHCPHPTQHAFLWLTCLEALFGGAAGGGKSDALLMGALQYVDVKGYNAILFRKTFADLNLPGSLIPRSKEWLSGTDAKWNENDSRWTFPSGATLSFGYMRNDEDRMRYQSAEFQYIGFDELTHFTELQYTYMFSRIRKPQDSTGRDPLAQVPLRIRGATNPGGPGHVWVKKRFIKPMGERADEPDDPTKRIFIPSKLDDNPSVDAETYKEALAAVDDATRAQLVDGDWDAREPGDWVIPDPTWIDAAVAKGMDLWESADGIPRDHQKSCCIAIDWGEFTQAYVLVPMTNGGVYVLPSEVVGTHEDPQTVGLRILRRAENLGMMRHVPVARYDAAGIQSMRTFVTTARARPGWERLKSQKVAFGKYKKETMGYMRLLFLRVANQKQDRIIAIHPENERLIQQLRSWKRKNDETEDTDKIDDHGCDALIAGIAPTAAANRKYVEAMIEKAKQMKKEAS